MIPAKLCGALLLTAGGLLAGICVRRELRARTRMLYAAAGSLARMRREITQRLTPLPDLIEAEKQCADAAVQSFFAAVSRRYAETACFSDAWACGVPSLRLPPETSRQFSALGDILGCSDAASQGEALSCAEERLLDTARTAEADARIRGSLYLRLLPGLAALLSVLLW